MSDSCLALQFPAVCGREVVARFDGGDVTSDAGLLLVRQADRQLGLTAAMAAQVRDSRQASKVTHTLERLLSERVFAIAAGYEDANDLDALRQDPGLQLACGVLPGVSNVLASQPTLSRLENAVGARDLLRMGLALAARVVAQLPAKTRHVVLDVDATPDPCHGQQQLRLFSGHYGCHCYLPLHLHVTGPDGRQRLLGSLLRPGNASYRPGLLGLLRRAVKLLRSRFPRLRITLRADAGFGYWDVLAFCERHGLDYLLGLSDNQRLDTLSRPVQMDAAIKYSLRGDPTPEYAEFVYKAGKWERGRRVIVKAAATPQASDPHQAKVSPRFVVTSRRCPPERAYRFYCQGRGEQENRIKELKLDCFSGRTSCHRFLANQLRLLLHSAAYVLLQTLQDAAAGTQWAKAQAGRLRLGLLKVGARVVVSSRKVWLHLPTSFPDQAVWALLHQRLCARGVAGRAGP